MERSAERIRIMCAVSCSSISIISVWNGPSRLLSCRFRILALLAPKMLATAASATGTFFKMTLRRAVPPVELRPQLRYTPSAATPLSRDLQSMEIGGEECREKVCQYVSISVGGGGINK